MGRTGDVGPCEVTVRLEDDGPTIWEGALYGLPHADSYFELDGTFYKVEKVTRMIVPYEEGSEVWANRKVIEAVVEVSEVE